MANDCGAGLILARRACPGVGLFQEANCSADPEQWVFRTLRGRRLGTVRRWRLSFSRYVTWAQGAGLVPIPAGGLPAAHVEGIFAREVGRRCGATSLAAWLSDMRTVCERLRVDARCLDSEAISGDAAEHRETIGHAVRRAPVQSASPTGVFIFVPQAA